MLKLTKKKIRQIHDILVSHYEGKRCALEYSDPFQLLVAARLSAQCTDVRVNIVTKDLFKKYPHAEDFASASVEEIAEAVRSCGLGNSKARDICAAARIVAETGMPDSLDGFVALPGVGRKIGNLMMGELYNAPGAVVVDTHCIRISNRLGLVHNEKSPEKIERILREELPAETSMVFCHSVVWHGREICTARKPNCAGCPVAELCEKNGVENEI